jgi:hypothetical protein
MAELINQSDIIGQMLITMSNDVTGSLFLTLLMLLIILIVISVGVFKTPFEVTAIYILPLLIAGMVATSEFLAFGGVMLLYMALIFVKAFWIN